MEHTRACTDTHTYVRELRYSCFYKRTRESETLIKVTATNPRLIYSVTFSFRHATDPQPQQTPQAHNTRVVTS